ncbi:MAG: hypothetical protein RIA69_13100 [Cyclobacteriaceae bacterium]
MTKTFTENDLLRFIYNDLSKVQHDEIQSAIFTDGALQEKLVELQNTKLRLDKIVYKPSRKTINSILAYSAAYEEESV